MSRFAGQFHIYLKWGGVNLFLFFWSRMFLEKDTIRKNTKIKLFTCEVWRTYKNNCPWLGRFVNNFKNRSICWLRLLNICIFCQLPGALEWIIFFNCSSKNSGVFKCIPIKLAKYAYILIYLNTSPPYFARYLYYLWFKPNLVIPDP